MGKGRIAVPEFARVLIGAKIVRDICVYEPHKAPHAELFAEAFYDTAIVDQCHDVYRAARAG